MSNLEDTAKSIAPIVDDFADGLELIFLRLRVPTQDRQTLAELITVYLKNRLA